MPPDPFNGPLFENERGEQSTTDLSDVLDHMTELIERGETSVVVALEAILNMMRPGATEMSTDVLAIFNGAMAVQGYFEVAKGVRAMWLASFPWGFGFHIGFEHDYPLNAISLDARTAIVKSFAAILNIGGVDTVITDNGTIRVVTPDGTNQDIDIDTLIGEFRQEIDRELDDHPPTKEDEVISEWMKKWMP